MAALNRLEDLDERTLDSLGLSYDAGLLLKHPNFVSHTSHNITSHYMEWPREGQEGGEEGEEVKEGGGEEKEGGSIEERDWRDFRVNDTIDCLDTEQKWLESTVQEVKETQVYVSFNGSTSKWNEWCTPMPS